MIMKPEQERVQNLLKDTITTLCRNSLQYMKAMKVQGLLGVTLDDEDVFVVHINEIFQPLGADGVVIQQADSVNLGLDTDANKCAPSGIVECPPPQPIISAQLAVQNYTSPAGRNLSRRKAKPSRAIGGLSDPVDVELYQGVTSEINEDVVVKKEPEQTQVVVDDDEETVSVNLSEICMNSSADGDDEADVGLMKQSYINDELNIRADCRVASPDVDSLATSPTQPDINKNVPFSEVFAINPQYSAGGPFIAGVAQSLPGAASSGFQLQEVPPGTVVMGVPAAALGQMAENLSESWSTEELANPEEMGLTTRGHPRKRRMWYRPRSAAMNTTEQQGHQGTVMVQTCQRPRHNLGSKQQKDALNVHLVQPLVQNYLTNVVSLRVIWHIDDTGLLEDAWRQIVLLRKECDQAVANIQGVSFFISSITGAFSKPHKGKYQNVTVYPAISYWIISEKVSLDTDFNMVSVSNSILHGLGNNHVVVKPINIPMTGKLNSNPYRHSTDLIAPQLFVVMKDHTNLFTMQKVQFSAEVCGDKYCAVARFVVVDSPRFKDFLQSAVDQMIHLLPGLRLFCLENGCEQSRPSSGDVARPSTSVI